MKRIVIYTTPDCPFCTMAKEFFQEHRLPYEEKDVLSDRAAREEMVQKSGQLGVPVILVDDVVIVGFDRPRLTRLLGID